MKREFVGVVAVLLGLSACGSDPSVPIPSDVAGNDNGDASSSSPTPGHGNSSGGQTSGSGASGGSSSGGSSSGGSPSGMGAQVDSGSTTTIISDDAGTADPVADGGPQGTSAAVEPILPHVTGSCPMLVTGIVTVSSISVQVWAGTKQADKKGPMVVYWHVTGGTSSEAVGGIGMPMAVATEILGQGGVIVSPQNSTGTGMNTGNDVWYTGDFPIADQLVACAFQQYNLDDHRIYSMGGSAGALQAGTMLFQRSNYIAAVLPNSGGYTIGGMDLQNPKHVPNIMTMHGAKGSDVVIVDFSQQSLYEDGQVAKLGGFAVDCNTGLGHVQAGDALKMSGWQFLKDHPFGVSPEPYAKGLPSGFATGCKIITAADAIANPV